MFSRILKTKANKMVQRSFSAFGRYASHRPERSAPSRSGRLTCTYYSYRKKTLLKGQTALGSMLQYHFFQTFETYYIMMRGRSGGPDAPLDHPPHSFLEMLTPWLGRGGLEKNWFFQFFINFFQFRKN